MKIDTSKIIGLSEFQNDLKGICEKVETKKELFVFHNNKPSYVIMSINRYEDLITSDEYEDSESQEQTDESLEVLLNKIGKKTFVEYYYVFKEDNNPEDKLPESFTINSRRSRCSSARKIFKNGLATEALNNILQSSRLDDDTLDVAREILAREVVSTDLNIVKSEYESENENDLKIGKMARTLISKFMQQYIITDEEIESMQDAVYSKEVFNLNFSVLKEVDRNQELDRQKKDQKGYNRYYDIVISVGGKEYILCSQWVENLHKAAFEKWLETKLMQKLLELVNGVQSGIEFTINGLLNEYWSYVPFNTRKLLGKKFVDNVRKNIINDVVELDKKIKNCQVYRKV